MPFNEESLTNCGLDQVLNSIVNKHLSIDWANIHCIKNSDNCFYSISDLASLKDLDRLQRDNLTIDYSPNFVEDLRNEYWCYAQEGDCLFTIDGFYKICAPKDGFYHTHLHKRYYCYMLNIAFIQYTSKNYELECNKELYEHFLTFSQTLQIDKFSKLGSIRWDKNDGLFDLNHWLMPNRICISFNLNDGQKSITIAYKTSSNLSKPSSFYARYKIYLLLNDDDSLFFDEKSYLSFGTNENDNILYLDYLLTDEQILAFENNPIQAIRIITANNEIFEWDTERAFDTCFKKYAEQYIGALEECNSIKSRKSIHTLSTKSCYVYLMQDEHNGYYKIGISNKPEYREHTLQSEKPSIVLLKAKEFPKRPIAEAFESALHKTYEKQRLRGEWFKLSSEDVIDIIKSLS